MDNTTTTTQTEPVRENASIAEAVYEAVTPPPAPRNEDGLKILKKVALGLQTAVELAQREAEAQFHVVANRSWAGLEVISCPTEAALQECIGKLREELCARHRAREPGDIHIYVFHGLRFQLQKWPFVALVHGKRLIPLNPVEDVSPVLDVPRAACMTLRPWGALPRKRWTGDRLLLRRRRPCVGRRRDHWPHRPPVIRTMWTRMWRKMHSLLAKIHRSRIELILRRRLPHGSRYCCSRAWGRRSSSRGQAERRFRAARDHKCRPNLRAWAER